MPKYTKKSKVIHRKFHWKSHVCISDRPPRNALSKKTTTKTGVDDDMVVDDGASVCSNISDATSIYDEVESKELKRNYLNW